MKKTIILVCALLCAFLSSCTKQDFEEAVTYWGKGSYLLELDSKTNTAYFYSRSSGEYTIRDTQKFNISGEVIIFSNKLNKEYTYGFFNDNKTELDLYEYNDYRRRYVGETFKKTDIGPNTSEK